MNRKYKIFFLIIVASAFIAAAITYLRRVNIPVLEPAGEIARKERNLIYLALGLALIVVIPVFSLLIIFAVRYREGNKKAKYSPDLEGNKITETVWWLIPSAIIAVLSVVAWQSSHQLDPYKPIASTNPPINIQVVALDWKWLFIYPDYGVASVNMFQAPVNTPINFQITSDAPMNSFWIPQLGGQIYAMPGMTTQLHLIANKTGDYNGSSANISGSGFSGMTFVARSTPMPAFNSWINNLRNSPSNLTLAAYNKLAEPSTNNPVSHYSLVSDDLFNNVVDKYLAPPPSGGSNYAGSIPVNAGMQGMGM